VRLLTLQLGAAANFNARCGCCLLCLPLSHLFVVWELSVILLAANVRLHVRAASVDSDFWGIWPDLTGKCDGN
jgi:hypothetical protein